MAKVTTGQILRVSTASVVLNNSPKQLDDPRHVTAATRNHSKFLTTHSHSFAVARFATNR